MTAHLKHISSFLAMEVLARAQELEANGRDIIHLEVGEPDFHYVKLVDLPINFQKISLECFHLRYQWTEILT